MRNKDNYQLIFISANGVGPWPCFFCGEIVTRTKLRIHHRDHNHDNNELNNLKPCHSSCHTSHHSKGRKYPNRKKVSEETKAKMKISQSNRRNKEHEERFGWSA